MGIGKIYFVVVMVVEVFKYGVICKIVLVCLVVEVGESLGYLFGDMYVKINFYFCLFLDVIYEMMGYD